MAGLGSLLPAAVKEDKSTAERLRLAFEELGPTFVKLAQTLATRPDLIPVEYVDEFKKLHDRVTPLPFKDIEPVLIKHFSSDVEKVFQSFEVEALAAGSIAQVHRAILKGRTTGHC